MTPSERATNARLLLNNQVFHEAVSHIESDLLSSWKATHPDAWKEREKLHAQFSALQDVKHKLETFIHTAAMETTAKVQHGRTERYNARDY
jgi:prephenate dehydratase